MDNNIKTIFGIEINIFKKYFIKSLFRNRFIAKLYDYCDSTGKKHIIKYKIEKSVIYRYKESEYFGDNGKWIEIEPIDLIEGIEKHEKVIIESEKIKNISKIEMERARSLLLDDNNIKDSDGRISIVNDNKTGGISL